MRGRGRHVARNHSRATARNAAIGALAAIGATVGVLILAWVAAVTATAVVSAATPSACESRPSGIWDTSCVDVSHVDVRNML